jgi:hypothetical protein
LPNRAWRTPRGSRGARIARKWFAAFKSPDALATAVHQGAAHAAWLSVSSWETCLLRAPSCDERHCERFAPFVLVHGQAASGRLMCLARASDQTPGSG